MFELILVWQHKKLQPARKWHDGQIWPLDERLYDAKVTPYVLKYLETTTCEKYPMTALYKALYASEYRF